MSAHREENIDTEKNFLSLFNAINAMAEKYDMPILYSCHPRSRNRLAASGYKLDHRVILHEPLGFHDYNCLQMNAFAVVSDSGTLPEESSFFTSIGRPFPAICIRTSTERPEALDKACFVLSGIDTKGLVQSVELAVELARMVATAYQFQVMLTRMFQRKSLRSFNLMWEWLIRWYGEKFYSLSSVVVVFRCDVPSVVMAWAVFIFLVIFITH